jgi:O-antigen ligase
MSVASRRARAAGLALLLALLLAVAALLAWRVVPPRGGDVLEMVPLAADKSLGVNTSFLHLSLAELDGEMLTINGHGFRWLRYRFAWDAMEPQRGSYDWEASDRVVQAAQEHGLALIAVLDGSPAWARAPEDAGNGLAPPLEVRDYGDWVQAFVARYGDVVDHYQIWDEPNIAPHWGNREVDPAAYAHLLREGAIRVRAVDPGAAVLAAALAPNVESGGANMSDLLFLDGLYQAGAAPWFDIVAGQTYPFDLPPGTPPSAGELNWRRLELLRQVMVNHGDGETAMWLVSCGLGLPHDGEAVALAVEQVRLEWPWLGPMLWAAWSASDPRPDYALVRSPGAGEPTGDVLHTLAGFAGEPLLAWPGVYPADHVSGQYEGAWRVTPLAADIGESGDRLKVTFRGTRLDLLLQRGAYRAFLFVSVDGVPANALPRDEEGRAYAVLYDPLQGNESLTVARDLADGEHTAEIVAEGGWGQWAITGWGVAREAPPSRARWLPPALGLAAVLAFALSAWAAMPCWRGVPGRRMWMSMEIWSEAVDERWLLLASAAAALLLYAVPGLLPSLALLAILGLLLFARPWLGLPLIALALPFYQLGKPFLGKVFSMVEILTLLTAAAWMARLLLDRLVSGRPVRFSLPGTRLSALDWGVAGLALLGVLSLLWAEEGRVAARELRTVVLEAALFYALLRNLIQGRAAAWRLAGAWILGGALIAAIGIGQWILGQNVITADGVWRVRGFYGSPNNLALYLGRVFPLALALAVFLPAREHARSSPGPSGSMNRWLYALAAALMGLALVLTYSRGAWLAGVPAALLFLAALCGRRTLAVAALVLMVAAVLLLALTGSGRLTSLLETEGGTTFFRLQLWRSSLAMLRDHPLLGVGLDNFLYQYRSHYVLPTAWEEFNLSHPHNLLLDFWLRLGLGGVVLLAWLLVAFFRRGWCLGRALPAGPDWLLVAGLMAGMVNFVAHGLVDNAFFLVDLAYVFMLMLALIQFPFLTEPWAESPAPANPGSSNTESAGPGSTAAGARSVCYQGGQE